jgi:predicted aldo/keto reductase-like oxidoreductase
MEKIRLARTGLTVSKLGFGSIPIQRVSDDEEAIAVIQRCLDLGITFLDSANAYTTSEARIGRAIRGRRQGLVLATKSNARTADLLQEQLELSLKRFGVDTIDLYQVHNISDFDTLTQVLDPKGIMTVLEEAKRAGKIRHIGVTSHNMDVAKEAVKSGRFETLMLPFNFIVTEPADQLLPLCREQNVDFIAMKPLEGGMMDNVAIALKYLFQFPDVAVLVGIERVHEIDEIVQVLKGPLRITEEDNREMQRLRDELGSRFCRRCDYCQPCPEGIQISWVMQTPSLIKRLPRKGLVTGRMAARLEKALDCTKCGECEEKCPYHLPIRDMIEEYTSLYKEEVVKYQVKGALGE